MYTYKSQTHILKRVSVSVRVRISLGIIQFSGFKLSKFLIDQILLNTDILSYKILSFGLPNVKLSKRIFFILSQSCFN